jgi:hypothetical protein
MPRRTRSGQSTILATLLLPALVSGCKQEPEPPRTVSVMITRTKSSFEPMVSGYQLRHVEAVEETIDSRSYFGIAASSTTDQVKTLAGEAKEKGAVSVIYETTLSMDLRVVDETIDPPRQFNKQVPPGKGEIVVTEADWKSGSNP